ncbi:hypothetical protein [Photobacterium piscicola]|uniref:Uncharacterized protein n=1 Tax=Photobacterium piscicola TaxID=1378299 RepID=A0ABU6LKA6_9GAMM|nr:hypothetical protein [Photobacterium piscicola]
MINNTQREYKYPEMGVQGHGEFTESLFACFSGRICWPVLFFSRRLDNVEFIILEVNTENKINCSLLSDTINYFSKSSIPVYFVNFIDGSFRCLTNASDGKHLDLFKLMLLSDNSSHRYLESKVTDYVTIDFDYLLISKDFRKSMAFEVTTLFVPMTTKNRALSLIKKIFDKRLGRDGNVQIRSLLCATLSLANCNGIFLVCNSVAKNTSYVSINSNCMLRMINNDFLSELITKSINYDSFKAVTLPKLMMHLEAF